MPFNIEFMFYFYSILYYYFPLLFVAFLCFRTENMLYDIIDFDFNSIRFVLNVERKTNKNLLIWNDAFTELPFHVIQSHFESLEWYLFFSFNFQMFVFLAFRVVSVSTKKKWAPPVATRSNRWGLFSIDRSVCCKAKHLKTDDGKGTPFIWPSQHFICMRISDKNSIMHWQTPKQQQQIQCNKLG